MTETPTTEQGVEAQAGVVSIDDPKVNPFWPKNMAGIDEGPTPGPGNAMVIQSVAFDQADPATVTVTVATDPAASAWTINWGDGGADVPIAAGTLNAQHTYADKSAGKQYKITATSGADTDTKNIQY